MNKNKLTYLQDQILCHNIKLEIIDISNNHIPVIFQNTFAANTELRSINLHANLITQISPGAFHTNHNITDVDLSHNKLQELDQDVFSETQIKTLNLRGITALPPKAFQGMLSSRNCFWITTV
jgi:Leucine-rich repeat (LRR) protein